MNYIIEAAKIYGDDIRVRLTARPFGIEVKVDHDYSTVKNVISWLAIEQCTTNPITAAIKEMLK